MPIIASFSGIVIRMYFLQSEHNPPHVHAIFGEFAAAYTIRTAQMIDGYLPAKASSSVKSWIYDNRKELLRIWETQRFERLDI